MDQNTKNFIYAGIGGMISRTATAPFERLKVLYQNKTNIKMSYYNYIPKLIKKKVIYHFLMVTVLIVYVLSLSQL